ncbi:alpha/beta hydrolase [Ahniella affigens]|uniref:Alpha/beta hydrolase n=1 Tax=Ahniella affigens TaxID=2021234 RepID=A0A2P1PWN9_9GAMM|nr:alpha/beta hydrolase [Ahniella affigens]AVP99268.1 alpha/beta hydrolase [Ahniella affigens]
MNRRSLLKGGVALACTPLSACITTRSRPREPSGLALNLEQFHQARRVQATPMGEISYLDRGDGPVVLFLHGFPLNSFQWRGAIARLCGTHRCIAPDFLGLGYTRVAEGADLSPHGQLEMLDYLLAVLKIDQFHLIANDSGAAIAQLLLAQKPRHVRSLLLTNGDVETDSPPAALLPVIELAKQGTFANEWLAPWLADKTLARSANGIGGMCYSLPDQPSDDAINCYFTPVCADAKKRAAIHQYAIGLEVNVLAGITPRLQQNKVPVSIVWGMADTIFAKTSPDYLAATVGAVKRVRRLEGAKLFWPEEYPDIIAEEARWLWQQ